MNRLRHYGCTITDKDQHILTQIDRMIGQWDQYAFIEVLKTYQDFDFLLKRCFLTLVQTMQPEQAYAMLSKLWVDATADMYIFFEQHEKSPAPADTTKLKDLIELSFFYERQLLNRATTSIQVTPVISVVMPVYRAQQYLWESLRSLYQQTFQDFELILVNEYGNDDPLESIVSVFGDTRTTIVQKEARARLGASINLGIRQAKGEFIARMDADDIAHPERFAKQIDFLLTHRDIDFCGTQYRSFGITNNWNNKPLPLTHQEIQCQSLKYCGFLHATVMWRKQKLIDSHLWYDEELLSEDTEFFSRVAFAVKTANLPDSLYLYRREQHNISIENLKQKSFNSRSLAVAQHRRTEKRALELFYRTISPDEAGLFQIKGMDAFTYADALKISRRRLGRDDLSYLLPSDTSRAESIFSANLNDRVPVIWGYGWNGQVLEYLLQEQGFTDYRIVDQRKQELGLDFDSPYAMNIEELDGKSETYYILISMDKHFAEVAGRLERYGYAPQSDFIEFFL